jgi:hypothetical protein
MEKFWESVELMFFIYALAAVVAFAMAGLIKLIFIVIQKNKARSARAEARREARREARAEAEAGPGDPAPNNAAPGGTG